MEVEVQLEKRGVDGPEGPPGKIGKNGDLLEAEVKLEHVGKKVIYVPRGVQGAKVLRGVAGIQVPLGVQGPVGTTDRGTERR